MKASWASVRLEGVEPRFIDPKSTTKRFITILTLSLEISRGQVLLGGDGPDLSRPKRAVLVRREKRIILNGKESGRCRILKGWKMKLS